MSSPVYYHGEIANPLTEALAAITGTTPPAYTLGLDSSTLFSDEQQEDLQLWCRTWARPVWATGIGILDAADLIVREAQSNANIAPGSACLAERARNAARNAADCEALRPLETDA